MDRPCKNHNGESCDLHEGVHNGIHFEVGADDDGNCTRHIEPHHYACPGCQNDLSDVLEALTDMVSQHCIGWEEQKKDLYDREYDSMALSANADAMMVLAEHGKLKIVHEYGRRVIGKWVKEEAKSGKE